MIVDLQILAQNEDLLGAIVAGEGVDDLLLGGFAALIAMLGQYDGIGLAGHDVADDGQPVLPLMSVMTV